MNPMMLPRDVHSRRQLKRLHWVLIIASLVLILNMLATLGGLTSPLYSRLVSNTTTAVSTSLESSTDSARL